VLGARRRTRTKLKSALTATDDELELYKEALYKEALDREREQRGSCPELQKRFPTEKKIAIGVVDDDTRPTVTPRIPARSAASIGGNAP
jgi:hypothetical protein